MINLKSALTCLLISLTLFIFPLSPALAQTTTSASSSAKSSARTAVRTAAQNSRMANIKSRSDNEITKRLDSLNSVSTRISNATKISPDDKAKFSSEIQADISSLTTLKSKIDADTDLTMLTADAKTIFTDYRIYAIFLPQVHMLSAVDTMGVTADQLTSIASKLQGRIQSTSSSTSLQNLLSDMNSKISDSKTQAGAVESEIIALTPANFPASSTLKDARTKLKTGTQDLTTAREDARQILQGLKNLEGGNSAASSSANQY